MLVSQGAARLKKKEEQAMQKVLQKMRGERPVFARCVFAVVLLLCLDVLVAAGIQQCL